VHAACEAYGIARCSDHILEINKNITSKIIGNDYYNQMLNY
jgi:hypothetical protein